MRILSIDYGKKRTGIAVTDPLQIIAGGLATVSTSELYDFLVNYIAREPVERIVIGKPLQPNGQPSENLQRVQQLSCDDRWRPEEESPSGQGAGRRNQRNHHPAGLHAVA